MINCKDKNSILMLLSHYKGYSGHITVVNNLSVGLSKLGYQVSIGAFSFDRDPPEPIEKIKLKKFHSLSSNQNQNIDLIHNHQTLMNYYSLFTSIPFIFHYHGASMTLQRINFKISMTLCKNRISKIISVSHAAAEQIKKMSGNIPSEVIYNGVEADYFNHVCKTSYKIGEPQLLFVGNLFQYKNIHLLIAAMEKILKSYPNTHLQIIGAGKFNSNLISEIKKRNLEKHIEMVGSVDNNELKDRLSSCDLYVSASSFETFGLPLIEAMAFGKPVVVSDIPAHKEIIDASNGGEIFSIDINQIVDKIKEVYKNRNRYSESAKIFARNHSWENVCRKVATIYDKL